MNSQFLIHEQSQMLLIERANPFLLSLGLVAGAIGHVSDQLWGLSTWQLLALL